MRTHTFICGCGHSGTSLVANMFASHPDIFIPLEETGTFLDPETAAALWADLAGHAAASGKAHFAEKTPRHLLNLDSIAAAVPGARFVMIVRDGRDVAASFLRRDGKAIAGARRWLRENEILRAAEARPDALRLRYEDLIVDPEGSLRTVCDFAGLPFDAAMLRFHETPRLWFGTEAIRKGSGRRGAEHRHLRNWQVNQPLFDGRGAWRNVLGPEDVAFFNRPRPRALMAHFGYS